jgi:sugar/nucleoside kinase (ribokinase family)
LSGSFDVVCVGAPFLDLTFVGLPGVPRPGEELHADDLALTPGGAAITAVGAARLGLRAALLWPVGVDLVGRYLATALAEEGVEWLGREVPRSAVTAVLPVGGDRAMATYEPPVAPSDEELTELDAAAIVTGIGRAAAAPVSAQVYVTSGFVESGILEPASLPEGGCRALLVNELEARRLTGLDDPAAAAAELGRSAPTVVVTLGADGALEWHDGRIVRADAPAVDAVDTTGAGDLFAAAYVFADLAGLAGEERLALAVLYAALSTRGVTGVGGAPTLRELEDHARLRGLPTIPLPVSTKEKT